MLTVARIAITAGLALPLSGCVYALHPYSKPGSEKLHVVTARSGQYSIRINDCTAVPVPFDGRVVVDIPTLPRGCSVYVFGLFKVGNGSLERVRTIHVLRDGKVARRLSLQTIHELPLDSDGYRVVEP